MRGCAVATFGMFTTKDTKDAKANTHNSRLAAAIGRFGEILITDDGIGVSGTSARSLSFVSFQPIQSQNQ
jgi:hypothetical protein